MCNIAGTNSSVQPTTMVVNLAGTHSESGKSTVSNEDTQKVTNKGQEILIQSSNPEKATKKSYPYNLRPKIVNKSPSSRSVYPLPTARSVKQEEALKVTTKCNKRTHQPQQQTSSSTIRSAQSATIVAHPTVNPADDWRKTLSNNDRERIRLKIIEGLERHVKPQIAEDLDIGLIAQKYEETVWKEVDSRKYYFETIAEELYNTNCLALSKQFVVPVILSKVLASFGISIQPATIVVQPTVNPADDWRKTLSDSDRKRIKLKIIEGLKQVVKPQVVASLDIGLIAQKYEETVWEEVDSRKYYFETIAVELDNTRCLALSRQFMEVPVILSKVLASFGISLI